MLHVFGFEDHNFSVLLKVLADAAKGKEETNFTEWATITALIATLTQEGTKQRSVIEWHKYPEELPPNYGYYLIKEETGNVAIEHFGAYGFKDSIGILCWANPIEIK